jgi:hypothetical protein
VGVAEARPEVEIHGGRKCDLHRPRLCINDFLQSKEALFVGIKFCAELLTEGDPWVGMLKALNVTLSFALK